MPGKLTPQLTADDELDNPLVHSVEKILRRGNFTTLFAKVLVSDVIIDNSAHLTTNPDGTANFLGKELPVTRRRIQYMPPFIHSDGMDLHGQIARLEVEN